MNALKFGERISNGAALSHIVLTGFAAWAIILLLPSNPVDLDISTILRKDFRNQTYAKVHLPKLERAPIVLIRHTRDQEFELQRIATDLVDGKTTSLIALKRCDAVSNLQSLADSGFLTGHVSMNPQFNVDDMAKIKVLYPTLDFDHCYSIDVAPNQFTASTLICLFLLAGLIGFLWSFRLIFASWKNERMWKYEVQQAHFADRTIPPTFESRFIKSGFRFESINEPRTNRFWSGFIKAVHFAVVVFVFAMLTIAIENPLANLWLSGAVVVGFTFLFVYQFRILPLAEAWAPAAKYRTCPNLAFFNSGFHAYHQAVLESMGFESLGFFRNKTGRSTVQLFVSPDKTIVAQVGQLRSNNSVEGKRKRHFCTLDNYFDDSTRTSIRVNDVAAQPDLDPTLEPKDMLFATLQKHVSDVQARCANDSVKVIALDRSQVVEVMERFETLDKLQNQKALAAKGKIWNHNLRWIPLWMRTPLLLPLSNKQPT